MVEIKDFVNPSSCTVCPFAIPIRRRFGTTWQCQAEISFMDVTHCYSKMEKSGFCPLVDIDTEERENHEQEA